MIRAANGLRSDSTTVASAAAQVGSTSDLIGVPITAAERAQLLLENALGSKISKVSAVLRSSDTFGGAWVAGGRLHLAVTSQLSPHDRTVVTGILGARDRLVVHRVAHTEAVLTKAQQRVSRSALWDAQKVAMSQVDLGRSRVIIHVLSDAPISAAATLSQAFGPVVTVVRDGAYGTASACPRNCTSGVLYGGQWISDSNSNCTDGYSSVRGPDGGAYTLTAGHCSRNGQANYQGQNSAGRYIGAPQYNPVASGTTTNCDCEIVGHIPSGSSSTKVRINGNALYTFTHTASVFQGEHICSDGAAWYERYGSQLCATITNTSTSVMLLNDIHGWSYRDTDVFQFNIGNRSGDSGGSDGDGTGMVGINSGHNGEGSGHVSRSSKTTNVGTVRATLTY